MAGSLYRVKVFRILRSFNAIHQALIVAAAASHTSKRENHNRAMTLLFCSRKINKQLLCVDDSDLFRLQLFQTKPGKVAFYRSTETREKFAISIELTVSVVEVPDAFCWCCS